MKFAMYFPMWGMCAIVFSVAYTIPLVHAFIKSMVMIVHSRKVTASIVVNAVSTGSIHIARGMEVSQKSIWEKMCIME